MVHPVNVRSVAEIFEWNELLALFLLLLCNVAESEWKRNAYSPWRSSMSDAIGDTMKNFAIGDPLMGRVYLLLYKILILNDPRSLARKNLSRSAGDVKKRIPAWSPPFTRTEDLFFVSPALLSYFYAFSVESRIAHCFCFHSRCVECWKCMNSLRPTVTLNCTHPFRPLRIKGKLHTK